MITTNVNYKEVIFEAYCNKVDEDPTFVFAIDNAEFLSQVLPYALKHNRTECVNRALDKLKIPADLSLKQRISYFYLLENET